MRQECGQLQGGQVRQATRNSVGAAPQSDVALPAPFTLALQCRDITCQGNRMPSLHYRGTIKHKHWRPGGGYGTLCPKWTHEASSGGLAGDPHNHQWEETQAHSMLTESVSEEDGRRYATRRGIAFVAVSSGDGTWHGYPIPWRDVPRKVRDSFVSARRVRRRETRRAVNAADIRWALGSDDA